MYGLLLRNRVRSVRRSRKRDDENANSSEYARFFSEIVTFIYEEGSYENSSETPVILKLVELNNLYFNRLCNLGV